MIDHDTTVSWSTHSIRIKDNSKSKNYYKNESVVFCFNQVLFDKLSYRMMYLLCINICIAILFELSLDSKNKTRHLIGILLGLFWL